MRGRLTGYVVTAVAAVVLPLLATPAAQASVSVGQVSVSGAALDALCAPQQVGARTTPKWRRGADTPQVTQADLDALSPAYPALAAQRAASALPAQVTIPVHVTIVRGKHRGETGRSPASAKNWISILNRSFAGTNQGADSDTRYSFRLASVRVRTNDSWYHAVGNSAADWNMRRTMHRGTADDLNLYITRPGSTSSPILGFARFPWQYADRKLIDGVTVSSAALPSGAATNYNAGDTLVHEVGHWMGLFHTFQGGCSDPNDYVADTPREREPNFACQKGRDSCTGGGRDPVENFMDYSYDSCMTQFTAGQSARMDLAFERYRFGR